MHYQVYGQAVVIDCEYHYTCVVKHIPAYYNALLWDPFAGGAQLLQLHHKRWAGLL